MEEREMSSGTWPETIQNINKLKYLQEVEKIAKNVYRLKIPSMCVFTSDLLFKNLTRHQVVNHLKFNNISDYINFLGETQFNLLRTEFYLTSRQEFSQYERNRIKRQYNIPKYERANFLLKKPKLRLLTHGFNLFHDEAEQTVYLSNSWMFVTNYFIRHEFDYKSYLDFLNQFKYFLENFKMIVSPGDLFIIDPNFIPEEYQKIKHLIPNLIKFIQEYSMDIEFNAIIDYIE